MIDKHDEQPDDDRDELELEQDAEIAEALAEQKANHLSDDILKNPSTKLQAS